MLHRSIQSLYVCKANNSVKKGRSLKRVPQGAGKNKIRLAFQAEKQESRYKQKNKYGKQKQKTETIKTRSHETNRNDQKTESKNFTETYSPAFNGQNSCRYVIVRIG